jgi:hypothetical protein
MTLIAGGIGHASGFSSGAIAPHCSSNAIVAFLASSFA